MLLRAHARTRLFPGIVRGRRVRMRHLALAFLALTACGSSNDPQPTSSTGTTTPGASTSSSGGSTSGSGATSASTPAKSDGSVGSACRQKTDCDQSLALDCVTQIPAVPAAGFPGKTYPNGMCTRRCGQPNPDSSDPVLQNLSPDCGKGATCMQSSQSTGQGGRIDIQMCVKTCTSNDDCRQSEGYVCLAGAFGDRSCQPN